MSTASSFSIIKSNSYAFIQEAKNSNETAFSYPLYYLDNSTTLVNDNWASAARPPIVRLDWIVGTENCSRAKNSTTYACRDDKSVCVNNYYSVIGYTCSCVQGYDGNPYLPGGCQTISSSIAKVGCLDQCGEVSIPFPFGVGPNCYLEPSFEVVCNTATNPEKPYLRLFNTEILELNSSKILVNYFNKATTCNSLSDNQVGITKPEEQKLTIDLLKTQYTLSDENWITAIGCDVMVVGVIGEDNPNSFRSSCAAICSDRNRWSDNRWDNAQCEFRTTSFGGDGCCRVPVPRGTAYLEANFTQLSGRWTMNCKEARQDPAMFACGDNSDCVDFDAKIGGYLCNCSRGYKGNPYLNRGCQDIDECADNASNTCISKSTCENDLGTFHCSCPKGHFGDGKKDGTGCIQLPPSKTKMIILTGICSGLGFLVLLSAFFCCVNVESEDVKSFEDMPMISDIKCTRKYSYINASAWSSDTHPLVLSTTI
ncbi:wall-associated receptor kinase-like 1 [Salvia divinorum]|uniref:Wall-associated receptor kinase-like 1 n=1 Tax=Salvia divinorum TaxID=28513 RepID=A0ABD1HRG8_SALDI